MSGRLSDLAFQTSYHKGRDELAEDFYLPCMRRAAKYDRAVGYFRSTVFLIAWPALRDFVSRGGQMRVLCSQVLAEADISALDAGYAAQVDRGLAERLGAEVDDLLNDPVLREPARVLAALVARGTLDVKIAVLRRGEDTQARGRIFHDKLGIFEDEAGNRVIFKGSMNETWSGLAADGNLESVDVAASWMGARDLERASREVEYFEALWADRYPGLSVRIFPAVARAELERSADPDWEQTVARMVGERNSQPSDPRGRTLKPHQAEGLASWRANDRKGILAFATGSGKTFTAITAIREALISENNVVVVVVPDQVLFAQWLAEIEGTMQDLTVRILRAGAGNRTWRQNLRLWTQPGDQPRVVLATVQTASSSDFLARTSRGPHLMLVADEVHRLGSPKHSALLDEGLFGARLGLSATPERAGDPTGTEALLKFFRGVVEPRYSLADAVRDGVLCRYFYRPHIVALTADEHNEWKLATVEVSRLYAQMRGAGAKVDLYERLQRVLLKRARIVKRASAKIPLAVRVLQESYRSGQRWIIYCDDMEQMTQVSAALDAAGFSNLPFHSQMDGDRSSTLRWLDVRGGIVVAIKCLDEGVDIPSVTHALILASSKNPREYIQRRGRVLRRHDGKALAYVHDAIVVPPRGDRDASSPPDPVTAGELARAVQFAQHADNPASASDLQQIAIEAGIDWRNLSSQGVEDAEV